MANFAPCLLQILHLPPHNYTSFCGGSSLRSMWRTMERGVYKNSTNYYSNARKGNMLSRSTGRDYKTVDCPPLLARRRGSTTTTNPHFHWSLQSRSSPKQIFDECSVSHVPVLCLRLIFAWPIVPELTHCPALEKLAHSKRLILYGVIRSIRRLTTTEHVNRHQKPSEIQCHKSRRMAGCRKYGKGAFVIPQSNHTIYNTKTEHQSSNDKMRQ